jgi:hypothetical protein
VSFVLWQFLRGSLYTTKLVEDEIHRPYIDRTRILVEYYNSDKSPLKKEDYQAKEKAITDGANQTVSDIQKQANLAKEQKDLARLVALQNDSEKRVHKEDSFGGKL